MKIFGLILAVWNIIPLFWTKDVKKVLVQFSKLWVVTVCFYSPIFNPWYFIPVIALSAFCEDKNWLKYVFIVSSFSMGYQMSNIVPQGSFAVVICSLQTLALSPLFFYKFKPIFIMETYNFLKGLSKSGISSGGNLETSK